MQNACSCSKISSVEGLKEEFEKHGKMVSCLGTASSLLQSLSTESSHVWDTTTLEQPQSAKSPL
jgi:phage gp16-like protein